MSIGQVLTESTIADYKPFPTHMSEIGKFTYYRTYSRMLPGVRRRETWKETCRRSVEYNVQLSVKHMRELGMPIDWVEIETEALDFFDAMYNLRQFLSGRTLWVGGADTKVAEKFPLANFNCSYLEINSWEDLGDMFYLLLVGTGVGFKSTPEMAANMAPINMQIDITHKEYQPIIKGLRKEFTETINIGDNTRMIVVGDSKEGWVAALRSYFRLRTEPQYQYLEQIVINYDNIRPKGEELKTFGGTASGHGSLKEMFEGFDRVFYGTIDTNLDKMELTEDGFGIVRPIHILDIGNLIGNNVVVGGVRRTAEIFLFDPNDEECMWAKYGVNGYRKEKDFEAHENVLSYMESNNIPVPSWMYDLAVRNYDENVNVDWATGEALREDDGSLAPYNFSRQNLYHRAMSNNSMIFEEQPDKSLLDFVFVLMRNEGEPGFINLEAALERRPNASGINPCAEILLASYGVCNLTTINVKGFLFVNTLGEWELDEVGLLRAQKRSARAGLRMTLATMELEHWDKVQQRDRLVGCSLTGWEDAMDIIDADYSEKKRILNRLRKAAQEAVDQYAFELRVNAPLLVTTVKPEGTLSVVAGGVSPGLHKSHSEYYIRRIRVNADDALAKAMVAMGFTAMPENGTPGKTLEEKLANARTLVFSFPVKSGAKVTKFDVTAEEQLDNYFMFQEEYTDHNSSNTITIRDHEWDNVRDKIWERWDDFIGVSFLSLDGGTYQQAPYEAIDEGVYRRMKLELPTFDEAILQRFDTGDEFDAGNDGCESGVCPIK
jgi:ribonucleoside-triphosphate reductase (thioredoxin)